MKFTFENLGQINKANLTLNKLTIISGDNNSGKTYLTYSIYFLLKNLVQYLYFSLKQKDNLKIIKLIKSFIPKLKKNGKVEIEKKEFTNAMKELLKDSYQRYKDEISDLFKVSENHFKKFECLLEFDIDFNAKIVNEKKQSEIESTLKNKNIIIDFENNSSNALGTKDMVDGLKTLVRRILVNGILNTFVVTAERIGIVLFRKELNARSRLIKDQLQKASIKNKKIPLELIYSLIKDYTAMYSATIHDNIDYVSETFPNTKKRICKLDKNNHISNGIEKMLKGYFKYDNDKNEMRFISKKRKNRFDIPLHFASTSIRSLSIFLHYIKYNAKKDDLIIIDEPESHLSLKNQIKFTRILAKCINSGLRILITTHSDFILKEFNNLIMLHQLKDKSIKEDSHIFNTYDLTCALDKNVVNAYLVDNHVVKKCKINEFGLDNKLVEKTINEINNNSYELENLIYIKKDVRS